MNTWSLTSQLREYTSSEAEQGTSKMATACLSEYKFPVQIVCLLPDATVVGSVCANDLLAADVLDEGELDRFSDPIEMAYHNFLTSCVDDARTKYSFNAP